MWGERRRSAEPRASHCVITPPRLSTRTRSSEEKEVSISFEKFGKQKFAEVSGKRMAYIDELAQQRLQVLGAGRPAVGIAGPAFRETGVAGRLALAHLVIALFFRRHWSPPPRGRRRPSRDRLQHDERFHPSAPASGGRSYRHRRGRAPTRSNAGRGGRPQLPPCPRRETGRAHAPRRPRRRRPRPRPTPPASPPRGAATAR